MKVNRFKDKKDETKNRKTLRQAAYQYMIDHAYPSPRGMLVNFYLPQKDDFFRKLEAREYMEYIRVAKEDGWLGYQQWLPHYKQMVRSYEANQLYQKRWDKMKSNASLKVRILLWIHKTVNRELKKYL